MPEPQDSAEIAAAIRELAKQVDALGNAATTAAEIIAKAISEGINVQVAPQPGFP
jgi:hypothetical protein